MAHAGSGVRRMYKAKKKAGKSVSNTASYKTGAMKNPRGMKKLGMKKGYK